MKITLLVVLALLYLASLLLKQALNRLPTQELRWRSRSSHDKSATALLKLLEIGAAGRSLAWLIGGISLALLAWRGFAYSWWAGSLTILAGLLINSLWQPVRQTEGWLWQLSGSLASFLSWLLNYIRPLVDSFNNQTKRWHISTTNQQIFIKEDLLALLHQQANQPGNRIDQHELERATAALRFADQTVEEIMTPAKDVAYVKAGETIGPSIMDELHKTHQVRFPVVAKISKQSQPEILGTLYIGQLLDHLGDQGKIRDLMSPGVAYINQKCSLEKALGVFLSSGNTLLMAVNDRAEVAGSLAIEKLLESALGKIEADAHQPFADPRQAADFVPDDSSKANPT